jgi:erythromycin esterase
MSIPAMKRVPWPVVLLALAACGGGGSSPTGTTATPDPGQVVAWLQQRSIPFDTDDPAAPSADLQAVKAVVGQARVVALGEGTHGTAEFFRMKHRFLKLLVEEMGFTAFGIEASFPDTEPINEYVLFGRGDARQVLAGQGFWTWRTEEVLAMVEWMREYNRLHGPVLSFRGFDMQHPLPSMDAVVAYLDGVDRAAAARAEELYAPYRPYATGPGLAGYRVAGTDLKAQVRANVAEVVTLLDGQQAGYVAATSPRAFADARQHARVVEQAERLYAALNADITSLRDAAMAENALWLMGQAGPDARIVLWAHNFHVQKDVAYNPNTMGVALDRQLGAEMVVMGFAFGQGACTAIGGGRLGVQNVPPPVAGSYEETFSRTGRARFLLDVRGLAAGTPGPDWFLAGHGHRTIGAVYDPSQAGQYFARAWMDRAYDVVVYFENTTASRVYQP